jgi:hypothetical protein
MIVTEFYAGTCRSEVNFTHQRFPGTLRLTHYTYEFGCNFIEISET